MGNQDAQKKATKGSLRRLHQLKDIPDLQTKHGIFEGQVTTKIQQTIQVRIFQTTLRMFEIIIVGPQRAPRIIQLCEQP